MSCLRPFSACGGGGGGRGAKTILAWQLKQYRSYTIVVDSRHKIYRYNE